MALPKLSATIELQRHHALPIELLRQRLESLREKFSEGPMSFVTIWSGNTLKIAGAGFKGEIEIGVDRVDLTATISGLVMVLKASIETQLALEMDQLVVKNPPN